MKILILNPNSSGEMTQAIRQSAEDFADDRFTVDCLLTSDAPVFIESYEDIALAAPGMIRIVRENENKYDAFIIACHCDPNIDIIKEITDKPVIGIGEASMKTASMLGHSFSVISASKHSVPMKEDLVRKYHLQDMLASVRAPGNDDDNSNEEAKYYLLAKAAIEEDNAEVIVLGCAGMAGIDKALQKRLNVPVLDGVACALILASGFVQYGISISKAGKYNVNG